MSYNPIEITWTVNEHGCCACIMGKEKEKNMSEKPLVAQFEEDLNTVIDKYREQGLSVAEAVGTLETVKLEMYLGQRENDEGDNIIP